MAIELDHFFILIEHGLPQVDDLIDIGWIEGTSNIHPGQGTANRRFFFSNSTLEFLYIRDLMEASTGRAGKMHLAQRVNSAYASPFGIIVRTLREPDAAPFPGWKYCPEYFHDDQCFHVGENSNLLEEPLCICKPSNLPKRKKVSPPENPQWRLTELRISVPVARASSVLKTIAECKGVSLRLDEPHRLELVFNDEKESQAMDMTAHLPLLIRW